MILEVDLTAGAAAPRLIEPADLGGLRLRALVPGGEPRWEALAEALAGTAAVTPGAVRVGGAAIERLAGPLAGEPEWRAGLERLLESSGEEGALRAEVEWEPDVAVEGDDFRHVLGHFPTGVTVVTANGAEGPVGMSCNAFTSVSLDPPLIAICPAKTSETWPRIRTAGRFLVNLMHRDHEELVRRFARKGINRFAAAPYHEREAGPALDGALAWIECTLYAEHDAGDHTIALGRVTELEAREGLEPLIFFRGSYGTFSREGSDPGPASG